MKRALTGIAAAAVVLGSVSPMAFAATTTSGLTKAGQLPIVVNGSVLSNPYEMTGKDSGNTTGFFPVYYFEQALNKIGFTATWDGTTHTFAITAPGVTPSAVAGGVGTGNTTVTVNGTVVKKFNTQAAKDPAASKSAAATTYMPVYYINNVLTALGINGSFSGQTGLKISANAGAANLSPISQSGASVGSGTQASPATVLNGGSLKLSTTLTDANGNPIVGTQVTFRISNGTSTAPTGLTAMDSNNDQLSATYSNPYTEFSAYTNGAGVATINLTGPAGTTTALNVQATAPYQVNGSTLTSSTLYTEFVAAGSVGITPFTSSDMAPYTATLGTAVPVTVTLPTENGAAQSNVALTFGLSADTAGGNTDSSTGFFTNSAGADLGTTQTVYTNSAGQAIVWVNSSDAGQPVTVTVNGSSAYTTVSGLTTSLVFAQGGTPQSINNLTVSNTSPNAGQDVTISGQVQDAQGNPVANAQLLLVGSYNTNTVTGDSDNAYVSGSTTTDFPNVSVGTGVPATSSYGDLITTDANGNFSAVVTDSNASSTTTTDADSYLLYPVENGFVSGDALNSAAPTTIVWNGSTSLNAITAYASNPGTVNASDATSVSGIEVPEGTNTDVYFAPVSTSAEITNQTFTYNVSASNGGDIEAIDGNTLRNPVSATTATVTYNSAGNYTLSVPGGFTTATPGSYVNTENVATPVLDVTAQNSATGNTVVTVANGSVKATATIDVTAGTADQLASVSPVSGYVASGQSQTVNFTVEDSQGNPLANSSVPVVLNGADAPLWITQVNGQTLQQTEAVSGGTSTEPTPIPLYAAGTDYTTEVQPGIVNASGVGTASPSINVYTDANGKVSLTIQDGNVPYFTTSAPYVVSSGTTDAANDGKNGTLYFGNASSPFQVQLGSNAATTAGGQFTFATSTDTVPASVAITPAAPTDVTLASLSANDTITPTVTVKNAEGQTISNAGTYALTPATGAASGTDYTFDSATGALTIIKGSTVTGTYTVTYTNTANSAKTASYSVVTQ